MKKFYCEKCKSVLSVTEKTVEGMSEIEGKIEEEKKKLVGVLESAGYVVSTIAEHVVSDYAYGETFTVGYTLKVRMDGRKKV